VSFETKSITEQQRDRILAISEGHFTDLKAKEIAPGKLIKTLSAFANADGGELYVGVSEDKANQQRTWIGFDNPEAANGHVQALENLFPLGHDFSYAFLSCDGASGLVLQILVHKTRDIKRSSDGVPYPAALHDVAEKVATYVAEQLDVAVLIDCGEGEWS